MAASRTISIRLGVDGSQEIKSALEGLRADVDATSQRVRASLEGLASGAVGGKLANQLTAAATRIAALQKALGDASASGNTEAGVAIQNRLTAAMQGYAAILDRTRASISPLAAAEQARARAITDAANALAAGAVTESEATSARERAIASYNAQIQKLREVTSALEATKNAAKSAVISSPDFSFAQNRGADIAAYGAELDRLRAKFNPLFAVSKQYEGLLSEISDAERVGAISASEAARARESATAAFSKANAPIIASTAALKDYAAAAQAAKSLVISSPGFSFAQDRGADIAAYGAELDRLRAKYNPLFAAERQYRAELEAVSQALKVGAINEAEAKSARATLASDFEKASTAATKTANSTDNLSGSSRNANTQLRLLGVQAIQTASGLATGQPILTTLVQQGHQVADSLLATGAGFSTLGTAAKGLLSAVGGLPTVLGVATVGALVAVGAAANSNANRLADLRESLRLTHTDYAALADQVDATARRVAASSTLTRGSAEEIAKSIASAKYLGEFAGELDQLTRSASDFSRVAGVDGVQAGKMYRLAIDDASAAVKQFADLGLPSFDAALVRTVQQLDASGQHADASRTIFKALVKDLAGAKDDTSELSKAFTALANSLTGTNNGFKGLGDALTGLLADTVKSTVTDINNIVAILEKAYNLAVRAKGLVTAGPVVDATTGQTPTGVTLPARYDGVSATDKIYQIAQANQIQAQIADIATRVANVESRGGYHYTPTGDIKTSSKGALGMFQVMPETARDRDINPTGTLNPSVLDDNILLGLRYLAKQINDFGGNQQLGLAAYNAGPGRVQDYLERRRPLPQETLDYVKNITGSPLSGITVQAGKAAIEGKGGAPLSGSDITVSSGLPESVQRALGTGNDGTQLQSAQDASNRVRELTRAIVDLHGAGQTTGPTMDRLQALLGKAREAAYGAVPAFDEITRASKDSLVPLQAQTGAARTVAEAVNQARISLSAKGQDLSDVQADEVRTQALQKLGAAFNDNVAEIDRQIAAQQRINAVYQAAGGNILEIAARTKAEAAARETAIPGTAEYTRQVEILTKKNLELANSQTALQQIQQNKGLENNIALIQAEANMVGLSTDQRTRNLAVMKAEQDQHAKYGPLLSKEQQDYIDLIGKQADYTAALNNQKAALSELSSFFSNTFDTISNAITQAFATGNLQALKFKDIMHSVASAVISEFAKLAIINPLKNFLFNENNQTLSSVGGVLGNLFGGGGALSGGASGSAFDTALPAVAAVASTVQAGSVASSIFGQAGTTLDGSKGSADNANASANASSSGGIVSSVKSIFGLAQGADSLGLGGSGGIVATLGDKLVTGITNLLGNTETATEIAAQAGGIAGEVGSVEGVSSLARLGAGLADAAGASTETATAIASAASTVADAIPYIGAAISVVTNLATGNFRGAAFVAAGAIAGGLIGSFFGGPGIGTAIGAAVGSLASSLFPAHPLHPFDATAVNAQGGQLAVGKTATQATDAISLTEAQNFVDGVNTFMSKAGLVLANADGQLGAIGKGIAGMVGLVTDPNELLKTLSFRNDPNDTSQFGVAKGALEGMTFQTSQALQDEILKIAAFADATAAVGIKLRSVGRDLTNISVSSVEGINPNKTGTVTDANGNSVEYLNDLRTALTNDLPKQTWANVEALDAEINTVNQFVNATVPGLLHPIEQTTSSIVDAVNKIDATYQQAIAQSESYGLDNARVLNDAEQQAIAIIRRAGIEQISATQTQIKDRFEVASGGGVLAAGRQTNDNFDLQARAQREALSKQLTDTYGDGVKAWQSYADQMNALEATLGAERLATAKQVAKQIAAAEQSILDTDNSLWARLAAANGDQQGANLLNFDVKAQQERRSFSDQLLATYGDAFASNQGYADNMLLLERTLAAERIAIAKQTVKQIAGAEQSILDADDSLWARLAAANGNQEGADLLNFDVKARQERQSFSEQLLATYGDAFATNQGYADNMALLERTLAAERLQIVQKYGNAINGATADQIKSAQGSVASLFTSLGDYVTKLQGGSNSPLSPTAQYDFAKNQFNAVASAAAAGDATSAGKLTGFADTLLSASRAVNGSGVGYATDFNRVIDAIQSVVQAPADALTNSFLALQLQQQTASITQAQQATTDAVNALRREIMQQSRLQATQANAA